MEPTEPKPENTDTSQDRSALNADSLAREIAWFAQVVNEAFARLLFDN